MDEKNKTVEQQILDSDLVNKLRNEFGEEGEDFAKMFIAASIEDKLMTLILFGWKCITRAGQMEMIALEIALKELMKVAPRDTSILLRVLSDGFKRIIEEENEH